jgi:hypothetical protein
MRHEFRSLGKRIVAEEISTHLPAPKQRTSDLASEVVLIVLVVLLAGAAVVTVFAH